MLNGEINEWGFSNPHPWSCKDYPVNDKHCSHIVVFGCGLVLTYSIHVYGLRRVSKATPRSVGKRKYKSSEKDDITTKNKAQPYCVHV